MPGYLTPNSIPTDTICRVLLIPNNQEFIANVTGAIQVLLNPDNWTLYGITPEQSADALVSMFDGFCFGLGTCKMIGEIVAYASPVSPDAKWLACDGSSLLRTAYPDLFAAIGVAYGSVDALHFNIPDSQGRVGVGSGSGSGLTPRAEGDIFGEESHVLTVAELASHNHTDTGHAHGESTAVPTAIGVGVGVPAPSALPSVGVTGSGNASISSNGSDNAHNNIQPSFVISHFIVALP